MSFLILIVSILSLSMKNKKTQHIWMIQQYIKLKENHIIYIKEYSYSQVPTWREEVEDNKFTIWE